MAAKHCLSAQCIVVDIVPLKSTNIHYSCDFVTISLEHIENVSLSLVQAQMLARSLFMIILYVLNSSVTEEHGKIFGQCTILGVKKFFRTYHNFSWRRKIFSENTYDVYCHCRCLFIVIPYNRINLNHDGINLNLVGAPNCRGPLVLELTLTTVRYATGIK
jgi:hypothetical protein